MKKEKEKVKREKGKVKSKKGKRKREKGKLTSHLLQLNFAILCDKIVITGVIDYLSEILTMK